MFQIFLSKEFCPSPCFLQLEKCAQDLGSTSKAVGSSMAQLLTCAAQGNEHYTGTVLLTISESSASHKMLVRGLSHHKLLKLRNCSPLHADSEFWQVTADC